MVDKAASTGAKPPAPEAAIIADPTVTRAVVQGGLFFKTPTVESHMGKR